MSENSNTKQAVWVGLSSLFSLGFGIISSMILSRYFGKNDYGTYKQVLYVYNTLLLVFTLGLPKAFSYFLPRIPLCESKSLINKITNLFFLLGGLLSIFLYMCADLFAEFLKNPDLGVALKIFSPVPFLMMPTMGLESILAAYKKTKILTIYTIVTRMLMLVCVVSPVIFFNGSYIQSIIGFIIASLISFFVALYFEYLPIKNVDHIRCKISYKEIFEFSLPLLYASLWGVIITSTDQFFISRYFGRDIFAEFSNGAMELPFIGMITGACAIVLSPVFSRMSHEKLNPQKEIFPLWMSVFEKTVKLVYPLVIYCWFFADVIMTILYGQQYENSYIYFRIKLIANFFTLIVYAPLLINIGKVKYYSNVQMYGVIVLIIFEYLGVQIFDSPYLLTGVSVLCQLGRIYFMLICVAKFFNLKLYQLLPIKLIVKILLPSVIILAIEYYLFLYVFTMSLMMVLVLSFIIYVGIYFIYTKKIGIDYFSIVEPLIKR